MRFEEAHIIEETELRDSASLLARGLDWLTKGRKSTVVTESLILSGLVEDPEKMRSISEGNKKVLDEYFELIDYEQLVRENSNELTTPVKQRVAEKLRLVAPSLALGIALGVGASLFIEKRRES
ncbi:MAG: hypothetical protein AAFW89_13020 [Bacteroidota bacterium]